MTTLKPVHCSTSTLVVVACGIFICVIGGLTTYLEAESTFYDFARLPEGHADTAGAVGELVEKGKDKYWAKVNTTATLNDSPGSTINVAIRCPVEGTIKQTGAEKCLNETLGEEDVFVFIDVNEKVKKADADGRLWAFEVSRVPEEGIDMEIVGIAFMAIGGVVCVVLVVGLKCGWIKKKSTDEDEEMGEVH